MKRIEVNTTEELIQKVRKEILGNEFENKKAYELRVKSPNRRFYFDFDYECFNACYEDCENDDRLETSIDSEPFTALQPEERADIVEGFVLFAEKTLFDKLGKGE